MVILGKEIFARRILQPCHDRTVHEETGMTFGASFAGYDIRIKQDMVLLPEEFILGSSVEHFTVPRDLIGFVHDKSTLARMGLLVGLGVIEPGWNGYLTLELKNQNSKPLHILAGQPIAQIVFHRVDGEVAGYDGRYQSQPNQPVNAMVSNAYSDRHK